MTNAPAAHIALMRREVVDQRGWVTAEQFADMLGVASLIPGPSSTEMAIYLGYRRAGLWGLVLAGLCFILPAMLIVLLLAWAYNTFFHKPHPQAPLHMLARGARPDQRWKSLAIIWRGI